jgi:hypothetical protein
MGWFNKKKEEKKEIPSLSELPKLPEIPRISGEEGNFSINKLPSFPNNSLGEKFSQNTIKEAVTGKKEGEEVFETDDFARTEDKPRMMQKPPKEFPIKEFPYERKGIVTAPRTREVPEEFREAERMVRKTEPIFIRIDKFEESLDMLEKIKKEILEIEKMLRDVKRIKEEEEKELESWESRIQITKEQIEKIDRDIFSKLE